jgi:hypothetical protein
MAGKSAPLHAVVQITLSAVVQITLSAVELCLSLSEVFAFVLYGM